MFEQSLMAGAGLGIIATIRIAIATIFQFAASRSRAPRTVRAFALIVLLAGLATPWFGTERDQMVVNDLTSQGVLVMRINAFVGLAIDSFPIFALSPQH